MADFKAVTVPLLKCSLMLGLIVVTYTILLYNCIDFDQNSYHAAILDKIKLLEVTPSPKLVFVGGSTLAFGLDSLMVKQALGVPVVNMGLHARLGLKFMLDQVQPSLNKGDIVVVVPEYDQFTGNLFYGGWFLIENAVFTHNLRLLLSMPPLQFADNLLKLNRHIFDYNNQALRSSKIHSIYARNKFNSYGDMMGHLALPNQMYSKKYSVLSADINQASVQYLHNFISTNDNRGIITLVIYPSVARSYYIQQEASITMISGALRNKGIKILSPPQDVIYDDDLFYDTYSHLNARGRKLRSEKIIQTLKVTIGGNN